MKFGRYLDKEAIPEWRQKYLNYRYLKDILRAVPLNSPEQVESQVFFTVIDGEFAKIDRFYRSREAEMNQKCKALFSSSSSTSDTHNKALRKAFLHLYADLDLIRSFRSLNLVAFAKIFKKYDKVTNSTRGAKTFQLLKKNPLWNSSIVDDLCGQIEAAFQERFTGGDRHKAMHQLRLKDLRHQSFHGSASLAGFLWGSVAVLVWNICSGCLKTPEQRTLAAIYAGQALPLLLAAAFYLNILGYKAAFINYRYIFAFEQRSRIHESQYLALIGSFALLFSLSSFILLRLEQQRGIFALLPAFITALPAALPAPVIWSKSRLWMGKTLSRVFSAPLVPVHFADFFVADEMCSLAVSWQFWAWSGLYALNSQKYSKFPSQTAFIYLLPIVPFLIRFLQCLRRFRDSQRRLNLFNAFKYSLSILAFSFRALFASFNWTSFLSVADLLAVTAGLFSLYWDLVMDFGLLQSRSFSKNFLLRSQLAFSSRFVYYAIMICDCLARLLFLWPLLCRLFHWQVRVEMILSWGVVEVIRRFLWNFLRLEYEHLNNCDAFHALHDLEWPLLRTADLYYREEQEEAESVEVVGAAQIVQEEENEDTVDSIEQSLLSE